MAYARHALLQFGGTIGPATAPFEEWSCGIRVHYGDPARPDQDLTPDNQEEYLNDTAVPALHTFITTTGNHISTAAVLKWAKFNALDENGRYVNPVTTEYNWPGGGFQGQGGPLQYPAQISLAVTLETDNNRGLANRGRIYLPTPTATLDASSGLFTTATLDGTAAAVVALLNSLKTLDQTMGVNFTPGVFSKVSRNGQDKIWNEITAVSIDTVPDTQRRRANGLTGTRVRQEL